MLAILPKALFVSEGERRGDVLKLNFKPNPNFHPNSHEAQVIHSMEGTIWVNMKENRLVEIDGHTSTPGILARNLHKRMADIQARDTI